MEQITQHDDGSMQIESDEVMEEKDEFDSEQVIDKPPSLVNMLSITPQPINNMLPTKVELI